MDANVIAKDNNILYVKNQSNPLFFFDSKKLFIEESDFEHSNPLNKWIHKGKINNTIIDKDGTILIHLFQYESKDDIIVIDIEVLSEYLRLIFSEIIIDIYKKMNYSNKLSIMVETNEFKKCYMIIRDEISLIKINNDNLIKFQKDNYVLDLQKIRPINETIILDFQHYLMKIKSQYKHLD